MCDQNNLVMENIDNNIYIQVKQYNKQILGTCTCRHCDIDGNVYTYM